jgi:hypothetical protein
MGDEELDKLREWKHRQDELTVALDSELGQALMDAGLWYPGDRQDGFIKGWQALAILRGVSA